jgi:hypothetical protein
MRGIGGLRSDGQRISTVRLHEHGGARRCDFHGASGKTPTPEKNPKTEAYGWDLVLVVPLWDYPGGAGQPRHQHHRAGGDIGPARRDVSDQNRPVPAMIAGLRTMLGRARAHWPFSS